MQGSTLQRLSEYSPEPSVGLYDTTEGGGIIEEGASREAIIKGLAAHVNEVTSDFQFTRDEFQLFISELILCPGCGGVKSAGCCEYAQEGLFD